MSTQGKLYELGLMMYILTKNQNIDFDLGTEITIGDKFDDIVIRRNDRDIKKYILIQAKLADDNNSLIDGDVLLGKKKITLKEDDFELQKYFTSYLRIKDQLNSRNEKSDLEKVIIFTNAGLDEHSYYLKDNIVAIPSSNVDPIPKTHEDAKSYKINTKTSHKSAFNKKLKLKDLKSDIDVLSAKLADYTINLNLDCMGLDDDYLKYYHMALIDEKVITVEEIQEGKKVIKKAKFTQNFIKKEMLSPRAKKLRIKIIQSIKNKSKSITEANFQKYMINAEWIVSKDFDIKQSQDFIFLPDYDITDESIQNFFKVLEFRVNELHLKDLSDNICNKEIKEVFLKYCDTDPKYIEFLISNFLKNWKNSLGSQQEGWILNTKKSKFLNELKIAIAKPKVKHMSEEYTAVLKKITEKFSLHFNDDFFTYNLQEDKKAFAIKTESILLTSIRIIECLKKNNQKDYIFLNLEKLEEKEEITKLINIFKDREFNLLILSYESINDLNDQLQQEFLTELKAIMKKNKKIIFISSIINDPLILKLKNKYNNQYKQVIDKKINLKDLENPSKILAQSIILNGQSITLSEFIDKGNEDFQGIIDSQILIKFINNEKIEIGSKPLGTIDLEGAHAELLQEEISREVLVNNLSAKESDNIFVISGIIGSNKKNRLLKILLGNEEQNLNNLVHSINQDEIGEFNSDTINRITVTDDQFQENNFKQLYHNNTSKKTYWIKLKNEDNGSKFTLQHFYNPNFYLQREFIYPEKVIIKNNILKELSKVDLNNFFLFTGVDNLKYVLSILQLNDQDKKVQLNINNKKIIIQKENGQAKFDDLVKNSNIPIHWLHVENNNGDGQIVWYKSHGYGALENLRQYIDIKKKKLKESDFIQAITNQQVVIIADEPGMGKSTSLTKLYESKDRSEPESKSLLESRWVIRVNLRDHLPAMRNIDSNNIDISKMGDFLSAVDSKLNSKLAQNLLKLALTRKTFARPLLMAFDGFDEVLDKDVREKMISLFKFLKDATYAKLWITSRLQYERTLENALSTFATEFKPIDDAKKREFINAFLKDRLSPILSKDKSSEIFGQDDQVHKDTTIIGRYAQAFLIKMQSVFQGATSKFIGTPLQLRLMLEGSVPHFTDWLGMNDNSDPDFSYLGNNMYEIYEQFINRKYDIYFKKKDVIEKQKQEFEKSCLNQVHQNLAKILIIQSPANENLNKFKNLVLSAGIIKSQGSDKALEFIHPTFSEYFVAQVFTHWIEKVPSTLTNSQKQEYLLKEILMIPDYQLIRHFMNIKLEKIRGKNEGLSKAILKQYGILINKLWLEKVNPLIINRDQTILHIAVTEGNINIINFILDSTKCLPVFEDLLITKSCIPPYSKFGRNPLYWAAKEAFMENPQSVQGQEDTKKRKLYNNIIDKFLTVSNDKRKIQKKFLLATFFHQHFESDQVNQHLFEYIKNYSNNFLQSTLKLMEDNIRFIKILKNMFDDYDIKISGLEYVLNMVHDRDVVSTLLNIRFSNPYIDQCNTILHKVACREFINAELCQNLNIVKWMKKHSANINAINNEDDNTLYKASTLDIIQLLVAHGADVNFIDDQGGTLLHNFAICNTNESDVVHFLVRNGVNVNSEDRCGQTALHSAMFGYENLKIIQALVSSHVNVNAADNNGWTALEIAVSRSRLDVTKFLVQNGAQLIAANRHGITALNIARCTGCQPIITLLETLTDDPVLRQSEN